MHAFDRLSAHRCDRGQGTIEFMAMVPLVLAVLVARCR